MFRVFWTASCLLTVLPMVVAQQPKTSADQRAPAYTIPDGEAHFTPDQLKEYYLVYTNSDVRYLRTVFDAYLKKSPGHESEYNLLSNWSSEYFRSKFVVLARDANPFGGNLITLIFEDRPDKIFVAWVYPEGEDRTLTLRRFEPGPYSEDDVARTRTRYRTILEDKEHAM